MNDNIMNGYMKNCLSGLDPELASILVEYQLEEAAMYFKTAGIKTVQDLQLLWGQDDDLFGSDGYSKGTLKIIKAKLHRFRPGHDATQDMDAELYSVLKQHKLLGYAFMLEEAGIKTVPDIVQIWGKQKDFKFVVGSANYTFHDLRDALHDAYGFWKWGEYGLRIGEHVMYYENDYS
jgi:hypothetical protein